MVGSQDGGQSCVLSRPICRGCAGVFRLHQESRCCCAARLQESLKPVAERATNCSLPPPLPALSLHRDVAFDALLDGSDDEEGGQPSQSLGGRGGGGGVGSDGSGSDDDSDAGSGSGSDSDSDGESEGGFESAQEDLEEGGGANSGERLLRFD